MFSQMEEARRVASSGILASMDSHLKRQDETLRLANEIQRQLDLIMKLLDRRYPHTIEEPNQEVQKDVTKITAFQVFDEMHLKKSDVLGKVGTDAKVFDKIPLSETETEDKMVNEVDENENCNIEKRHLMQVELGIELNEMDEKPVDCQLFVEMPVKGPMMLDEIPLKDAVAFKLPDKITVKEMGVGNSLCSQVFDEMLVKQVKTISLSYQFVTEIFDEAQKVDLDGKTISSHRLLQEETHNSLKEIQNEDYAKQYYGIGGNVSFGHMHSKFVKNLFDPGGYVHSQWKMLIMRKFDTTCVGLCYSYLSFMRARQECMWSECNGKSGYMILNCATTYPCLKMNSNSCRKLGKLQSYSTCNYVGGAFERYIDPFLDFLPKIHFFAKEDIHGSSVKGLHYIVVRMIDTGNKYKQIGFLVSSCWELVDDAVSFLEIDDASTIANLLACMCLEKSLSRSLNGSTNMSNQIISRNLLKNGPWFNNLVGSYWSTCLGWIIPNPYECNVLYIWSYFERGKNTIVIYGGIRTHFCDCRNKALQCFLEMFYYQLRRDIKMTYMHYTIMLTLEVWEVTKVLVFENLKTDWTKCFYDSALTKLVLRCIIVIASTATPGSCKIIPNELIEVLFALSFVVLEVHYKFTQLYIVQVAGVTLNYKELQSLRTRIISTGGKCHDPDRVKSGNKRDIWTNRKETSGPILGIHLEGRLHHISYKIIEILALSLN